MPVYTRDISAFSLSETSSGVSEAGPNPMAPPLFYFQGLRILGGVSPLGTRMPNWVPSGHLAPGSSTWSLGHHQTAGPTLGSWGTREIPKALARYSPQRPAINLSQSSLDPKASIDAPLGGPHPERPLCLSRRNNCSSIVSANARQAKIAVHLRGVWK